MDTNDTSDTMDTNDTNDTNDTSVTSVTSATSATSATNLMGNALACCLPLERNKEYLMAQSTNENIINCQEVGEETTTYVRGLLQLDTRNPPGNEVRAAGYLHTLFEAAGISGEIVGPSKARGTFIASLNAD